MVLTWYIEVFGEKTLQLSLCSPKFPPGLNWNSTWAYLVRGRPLTAWAMLRSFGFCGRIRKRNIGENVTHTKLRIISRTLPFRRARSVIFHRRRIIERLQRRAAHYTHLYLSNRYTIEQPRGILRKVTYSKIELYNRSCRMINHFFSLSSHFTENTVSFIYKRQL